MANTNLVILATKNNQVEDLESLLLGQKKLWVENWKPKDTDTESHNAFYYAIRSNNIAMLQFLIDKWPDDYFANKPEDLDELLSKTFKELKLKNIELSNEMELLVAERLIKLRFFCDDIQQLKIDISFNQVIERIELVIENINFLNKEYLHSDVDERFLFSARSIAQNIHILKRQLRSTYKKIPWEETEFCLIIFIRTRVLQIEEQHYNFVLTKRNIVAHLLNFSKVLGEEKKNLTMNNIRKFAELPKLAREKVVKIILKDNPHFEELYDHYEQLRDFYSLDIIKNCIGLALLVDCKEKEGQLVLTRALQVIGEYLKNTLESPNISTNVSGFLLHSLPKNTRKIVTDLRNSLSHSDSLSRRIEVEENSDVDVFAHVQNDIKKINIAITEILHKYRMKVFRNLLADIVQQEDFEELKETLHSFSFIKLDSIDQEQVNLAEQRKILDLIQELDRKIDLQTPYEKDLFKQIHCIITYNKVFFENMERHYNIGLISLKKIFSLITDYKLDQCDLEEIKDAAIKGLNNLKSESRSKAYVDILKLLQHIKNSAIHRMNEEETYDFQRIAYEIFIIVELELDNVKWLKKLRDLFTEREYSTSSTQRKHIDYRKELYNRQLTCKVSMLRSVVNQYDLENLSLRESRRYSNKKLLALIEILLLDILSILNTTKNSLTNNLLLLDNDLSVLIGKSLRNHLAHGNALNTVLLVNASTAILLNAKNLVSENALETERKIGKLEKNICCLKEKYNQDMSVIILQKEMFDAAKFGDMENLMNSFKKGADIKARSITLSTMLHFAAESPNFQVVKFVHEQNPCVNSKDIKGLTPMHVAAMCGREGTVNFFLQMNVDVNEIDNGGKTSLHFAAANNQKNVIELLLKNNASTSIKDKLGYSPVHYAVLYNFIEVTKVLLDQELNVDSNQIVGDFTALHLASEHGHFELVSYLLNKKADVNAKNDIKGTPLHSAAINGHLEIVKELIHYGADVNSATLTGCTALHCAAKGNYTDIVKILVKSGAEVNVSIKADNSTPLFCATMLGNIDVVEVLLKNNAFVNVATTDGITPLHAAVSIGHEHLVSLLLRKKALVDATNEDGLTALHLGAKTNNENIVRFLIKYKAKIDARENNNQTPLHSASRIGYVGMMDILTAAGACIQSKDKNGMTALHLSCGHGHLKAVKLLIRKGAKVEATCKDQNTTLHYAAMTGSVEIMDILISAGANIHALNAVECTPMHMAIIAGNQQAVKYFIDKKLDVNSRCNDGLTALHLATHSNNKGICESLIESGSKVDVIDNLGLTPLCYAIKYNFKAIADLLLRKKADVNFNSGKPLAIAIACGHKDMVQLLLKDKNINVNLHDKDVSHLFLAAGLGHHFIIKALIAKGANIKVKNATKDTILHVASEQGNIEIVKLMLENKADVNIASEGGITPLHWASQKGHPNVVKMLLNHKAKANIRDSLNRTPLEMAVSYDQLEVVKVFILETNIDINARGIGQNNWTLLQIAAQSGALEIVKYLTEKGASINAKNALGLEAVHIAARNGFVDIVKFFASIDELSGKRLGQFQCTPLHYAAIGGHLEVAKFLIKCQVDINVSNEMKMTPLYIAAQYAHEDFAKLLLNHGACYDVVDKFGQKLLDVSKSRIINLWLISTEKLFQAVKQNKTSNVEEYLKKGGFINVKNGDNVSPLFYASWKGYKTTVELLLSKGADPNIVGKGGCTPLHYATKFGKLSIVKLLLSSGATYNALDLNGKTPIDFSTDQDIGNLLNVVDTSFKSVLNGDLNVIKILNKNKDFGSIKAILNACNRANQTLLVAAIHNDFPQTEKLKEMFQPDAPYHMDVANECIEQERYQDAINSFEKVLEKRRGIFGDSSPATWDIQKGIAQLLHKQNAFKEALNTCEDIYQQYKRTFGSNNEFTLNIQSTIAFMYHDQGKQKEAIEIFEEVYKKQKELLGGSHPDVLVTLSHMALSFDQLGRYEEALKANYEVYDIYKETLGIHNPRTLKMQNNIAMVLNHQGEFEDSLEMYQKVYQARKDTLGTNHSDTLRALHNIAGVYFDQKRYNDALKDFKMVYNKQKNIFGNKHLDTLNTQCNIANVLFMQGKLFDAFDIYKENLALRREIWDDNHPTIVYLLQQIKVINFRFQLEGDDFSKIFSFNV